MSIQQPGRTELPTLPAAVVRQIQQLPCIQNRKHEDTPGFASRTWTGAALDRAFQKQYGASPTWWCEYGFTTVSDVLRFAVPQIAGKQANRRGKGGFRVVIPIETGRQPPQEAAAAPSKPEPRRTRQTADELIDELARMQEAGETDSEQFARCKDALEQMMLEELGGAAPPAKALTPTQATSSAETAMPAQVTPLQALLLEHDLFEYAEPMAREKLMMADLPFLTNSDLKDLGVPMGPRKRMLRIFAAEQDWQHSLED